MLSSLSSSWFQFFSPGLAPPVAGVIGTVGCGVAGTIIVGAGAAIAVGNGVGATVGVGAMGTGGCNGCCIKARNCSGVILRLGEGVDVTPGVAVGAVTGLRAPSIGMLTPIGSAAFSASLRKSTALPIGLPVALDQV